MQYFEEDAETKAAKKQKYVQKHYTAYEFPCTVETQKTLQSRPWLTGSKFLDVNKLTKGTYFQTLDTKYFFNVTKTKLTKLINGIVHYNNHKDQ